MTDTPADILEIVNGRLSGFNETLGLRFTLATPEEYAAELTVDERHLQPYGLVHGGVYASMVETVCSVGAAVGVFFEGKTAVGLDNSTSFLHAVREGKLRCSASPIYQGRRTQVWEARIHDDRDRLAATGRGRLLVLESGAKADGERVVLMGKKN